MRHAQGIHNVEGEKDFKAYLSPELFDAHLTPLGWNQVRSIATVLLISTNSSVTIISYNFMLQAKSQ